MEWAGLLFCCQNRLFHSSCSKVFRRDKAYPSKICEYTGSNQIQSHNIHFSLLVPLTVYYTKRVFKSPPTIISGRHVSAGTKFTFIDKENCAFCSEGSLRPPINKSLNVACNLQVQMCNFHVRNFGGMIKNLIWGISKASKGLLIENFIWSPEEIKLTVNTIQKRAIVKNDVIHFH